jgi:hypothetical protein
MFGGFAGGKPIKPIVSKVSVSTLEEVEIDPGVVELLKRPKAIYETDDHFNNRFLDGKWITSAGATTTFATFPGWLTFSGALIQAAPAGDWYIETEIMLSGTVGQNPGPFLSSAANMAAATEAHYYYYVDAATTRNVQFAKLVNLAFNAQYTGSPTAFQGYNMTHIFLRIKKIGTTYTTHWSDTGLIWHQHHSIAALGFTPTHFGLCGTGHANYFIYRPQ